MSAPKAPPPLPDAAEVIDSHCHLDGTAFADDRSAVIERARAAGVSAMITIGASDGVETNAAAVAVAEEFDMVWATVGVHPHDARIVNNSVLDDLRRLAEHPKVVGIGETGLDYYYEHSPRERQREAFRLFLELARATDLPCVVHLREAYDDAVTIMREANASEIGGVIHCFSGDREDARRFLDLGFDISFSGIVTFKNADEIRAVAHLVPSDRFLLETDAPYLTPVPNRGRRNEPAFVNFTAEAVADARGAPITEVVAQATANTRRRFRLPDSPR